MLLSVITSSLAASVCVLRADDVAPHLTNSPEVQRIRDLTLLGGANTSPSPAQLAGNKVVILVELSKALNVRIKSIDARLRESKADEPKANDLQAEREALLKRASEVETMLKRAVADAGN